MVILVVDDDPHIRELVSLQMAKAGYEVVTADNGKTALEALDNHHVGLVILDIMMPEMDGWAFCRRLREQSDIPVLMLTAKGETSEKVNGFQLGADDYVVKPFDPPELIARVRAMLKRYRIAATDQVQIGSILLDRRKYEVLAGDCTVNLTPKEFELLFLLASYPRQIFTRVQLIESIWGHDFEGDDRTVDVHVKRIRGKFGEDTSAFRITTVYGIGYRLEPC